jgi:hypothetical protein
MKAMEDSPIMSRIIGTELIHSRLLLVNISDENRREYFLSCCTIYISNKQAVTTADTNTFTERTGVISINGSKA